MSGTSSDPTPVANLSAPLKTVQETASDFSSDAISWLQHQTLPALTVVGIALATALTLLILRRLLLRLIDPSRKTSPRRVRIATYRIIRSTSVFFLIVLTGWGISQMFKLPPGVVKGIDLLVTIASVIQLGLWTREVVLMLVERRFFHQNGNDAPVTSALGVIAWLVNLCVWSLTLLLLLDNLGVNVTALIAGLGIGGLAVGLAAQGIISDLFSALSIVFDRPFERGDFITFDDKMGRVEKVGLKTSRLRALNGELIVVANNKLLSSVIHNHQQLRERRVMFRIGITYDTPPERIPLVATLLAEAVKEQPLCRLDRAHLINCGDSALEYEVVYYFLSSDFNPYRDAHQAILHRVISRFAQEKIAFAFPTRTVHLLTTAPALPQ